MKKQNKYCVDCANHAVDSVAIRGEYKPFHVCMRSHSLITGELRKILCRDERYGRRPYTAAPVVPGVSCGIEGRYFKDRRLER